MLWLRDQRRQVIDSHVIHSILKQFITKITKSTKKASGAHTETEILSWLATSNVVEMKICSFRYSQFSVRGILHISSRALWMLILNNTAPYTKLWFHYNQIRLVFCPNGAATLGSHASLDMGDLSKVSCCRISPLSWLICTKPKSVIPSFHWHRGNARVPRRMT